MEDNTSEFSMMSHGDSESAVGRVGKTGAIQFVERIHSKVFFGVFGGKDVAVKELNRFDLDQEISELNYLRTFNHQNIVKYMYHDEDHKSVYIVLEKCNYTLDEFIRQPDMIKEQLHPYHILRQMTEGMVYLHEEKRIVHRDLKPSNVLMLLRNGQWIVKISDFGISKTLDPDQTSVTTSGKGTKCYMAPEQMRGEKISRSTDIFALGLTFHFVLSDRGNNPFGETDYEIETNIRKKFSPNLDSIKNEYKCDTAPLVRSMLPLQKEDRLTIRQVQAHHLFWDGHRIIDYIQMVSDYLEKRKPQKMLCQKLEKTWKERETDVDWRKQFEDMPAAKKDIEERERWNANNPLQKLLRGLRKWSLLLHNPSTSCELRTELGSSRAGLAKLVKSRFPNLLPIVYEILKIKRHEEEIGEFYGSEKTKIGESPTSKQGATAISRRKRKVQDRHGKRRGEEKQIHKEVNKRPKTELGGMQPDGIGLHFKADKVEVHVEDKSTMAGTYAGSGANVEFSQTGNTVQVIKTEDGSKLVKGSTGAEGATGQN